MGYSVERSDDDSGLWSEIGTTGFNAFRPYLDTTYVDTDLEPATTYHYRLRPCNASGCAVEPSPAAQATTAGGS